MAKRKIFFSIVIASARKDIRECLDSLFRQDFPSENFEIIIVGEHLDVLESGSLKTVLVNKRNAAWQRNLGAREARGEVLAFIDDDAYVPPHWLSQAYQIFEERRDIAGLGGPNLLPPKASELERLSDAILTSEWFGSGSFVYSSHKVKKEAQVGELSLCNLFVRKKVFETIGGFNEEIGYGGEDSEFVFVGRQKFGYTFLYDSDVFVYHHRREFGLEYIKQRLKFRINTGRLLLIYPKIYLSNRPLWLGIFAVPLLFLGIFIHPAIFIGGTILYLMLLLWLSAKNRRKVNRPLLLPFAFFIHHVVYSLGLWAGILSVIINPKLRRIWRI